MGVVRDRLAELLRGTATPFLFIGSGLSRRYTDCEDWEGLLRVFADLTDRPYEYFKATAGGDLPATASAIAEEFYDIWWAAERYEASRDRWSSGLRDRKSAFKVEVAAHVATAVDGVPTTGALAEELELLRKAVVDGIITTNFDGVLESLFPDFKVFVGQDQMLFSNPQAIGEIYKIHGSCEQPESLVITAEDYERFEERNAYLAATLLTTFVEHPVIFLGYHLGDRNVQSILRSIARCLTSDNVEQLRDRLIFVQWDQHAAPEVAPHTIVIDDFVLNVVRARVPDFREVFGFLGDLRRTFPARLLRQLKEHVYELVLQDDPRGQLGVIDINDAAGQDLDVVFGVGIRRRLLGQVGYRGLDRWQLIDDVVNEGDALDPAAVIEEALPQILRSAGNVPTYKYLRGAGLLTKAGSVLKSAEVDSRIKKMADTHRGGDPASKHHETTAAERLRDINGIADLEARQGSREVYNYGTCLPPSKVHIGELREFLQRHRDDVDADAWAQTQYAKLACYLDWLEYRRQRP